MDITNKSGKPLSIPLPGGKKLFHGPNKTGQVANKAIEHPPLAKLIESGDVETAGDGAGSKSGAPAAQATKSSGTRHGGSGAMRQSGDR